MTRAERYYRARLKGHKWRVIAEKFDVSTDLVIHEARRYARKNGERWPITLTAWTIPHGKRGKAYYRLHESGKTWAQIAERFCLSDQFAALRTARLYARSNGLPWPVQVKEQVAA